MPAFLGTHGTLFEFAEFSHSGMPVTVTTADGTIDIPTTDLMQFAVELSRMHDQPPPEPHGKIKEFLDMAIAAAITEDRKVRINDVLAEYTEEMQRKLELKIHYDIARTIFG